MKHVVKVNSHKPQLGHNFLTTRHKAYLGKLICDISQAIKMIPEMVFGMTHTGLVILFVYSSIYSKGGRS